MNRWGLVVLLALAGGALAGLPGCGDEPAEESALAALVPADAPLFVEVSVRPSGEQSGGIERLFERASGLDPGAEIVSELDASFAREGIELSYGDDIEPWLGERVGLFVRSFEASEVAGGVADFAVLAEVDDRTEAGDFITKAAELGEDTGVARSYGRYDYRLFEEGGVAVGLIDEVLVLGTEASFKVAADSSEGISLAGSEEFAERERSLPGDPYASLFMEPAAVIEGAAAAGDLRAAEVDALKPLLAGPLSSPILAELALDAGEISLVSATMVENVENVTKPSPLLFELPAESWLAVALGDVGPTLEASFDELVRSGRSGARDLGELNRMVHGLRLRQDVLRWLGDAAAFVRGTVPPAFTAGVVAETSAPEAPRPLVARVRELAARGSGLDPGPAPEGADYGFAVGVPALGGGAELGVSGGRLVAVVGGTLAGVLSADEKLADDPRFEAAAERLEGDLVPLLFLHVPTVLDLAEQGGSGGEAGYARAEPYFRQFETMIAGSRVEDGLAVTELSLTFAE